MIWIHKWGQLFTKEIHSEALLWFTGSKRPIANLKRNNKVNVVSFLTYQGYQLSFLGKDRLLL